MMKTILTELLLVIVSISLPLCAYKYQRVQMLLFAYDFKAKNKDSN